MKHCLVTGAAGLLGRNLVKALLARGVRVRALVRSTPLDMTHERLEHFQGTLTDPARMIAACEGVDTVFHTAVVIALLGGRSVTQAYAAPAWQANVGGTEHLLAASRRQGVERFVYTSSVDVCLDGKPNVEMNQQTPYARNPKSVYAQTKIAAEQRVLAANGQDGLYTCSIRADGIYGPEPNLIFDALLEAAARGILKVGIGSADIVQDNSYIENLVHGELLAAERLGPNGTASGKAYFINDYTPQNMFEFVRPIIEGVGLSCPTHYIPRALIAPILSVWEHLHFRLGIPAPLLSPHELDKVTISHYGSIEDARRDLGYSPVKTYEQAIAECLPYCRARFQALQRQRTRGAIGPAGA
jgi:3beta-hydroxy-delta5-steroid dehydrogenase/steroid delta-isomerase